MTEKEKKKVKLSPRILFLLILVAGVGIFLLYSQIIMAYPQFTIYKNECHNETSYCEIHGTKYPLRNYILINNETEVIEGSIPELENYSKVINWCNNHNGTWFPIQQICEQKEVENDKYQLGWSKMCYDLCIFNGINTSSERCTSNYKEIDLGCGQRATFNSYEKRTSWLDENCKRKCIYFKDNSKYSKIDKGWICNNEKIHIFDWDRNDGIRYSCGNYTVEVKR